MQNINTVRLWLDLLRKTFDIWLKKVLEELSFAVIGFESKVIFLVACVCPEAFCRHISPCPSS
jgi:hypothetical protein